MDENPRFGFSSELCGINAQIIGYPLRHITTVQIYNILLRSLIDYSCFIHFIITVVRP